MGSDDIMVNHLVADLSSTFALKDLGFVNYFLGIQVVPTAEGILLSQTKYLQEILCKADMQNVNTQNTPMNSGLKLSNYGSEPVKDATLYRSIVGALQYATVTRPEIAYSISKVCQFMHQPLLSHWMAVKRILRYLAGTLDYGLLIKPAPDFSIEAFCDADWASDPDDRRSTTGYCIYFGKNLVHWKSQKQTTISRSSTEAEFRSLASVVTEVTWLQSLLQELHVSSPGVPSIWCDNQSTVLLTANPILHARTKHIELDLYFVRDKVLQHQIQVKHVPSHAQLADCLTKPISSSLFSSIRSKLSVVSKATLSLVGPQGISTVQGVS
ncbi:uncharacterized mitochondrial protein AtMg00810-like [Cannabis sativa]|uniref:uncharacterized mitochondrial protein AtMg00810-like n=1 Tax=Cannabis sativa TaxID=3483 RepID=UPI0029C9CC30|nr:uncharacterized mitochondrial protein AtMg00810-like [Cannabis sativa]